MGAAKPPRQRVAHLASRHAAHDPGDHQQDSEAGVGGREWYAPLLQQEGRDPEGHSTQGEGEDGLGGGVVEVAAPRKQLLERVLEGQRTPRGFAVVDAALGLLQQEEHHAQDDGRDEDQQISVAPAIAGADLAAQRIGHGRSHRKGREEDGEGAAALVGRVRVGQQRGRHHRVGSLADATHGPGDQKHQEHRRQAGGDGGRAPDQHPDGGESQPGPVVGEPARHQRHHGIDDHEERAEQAALGAGQVKVLHHQGEDGAGHVPVDVVDEVEPGQGRQDGGG